jgi:methylamine dehydrogenase heavy chain
LLIVSKLGQMGLSDDGALAYVYALIPSSQSHVVDLASGKLVASVDIAGCAMVYPYGPRSFGTICGDGTIGTTTVPVEGAAEAKVAFSRKFFDPDKDPIFENSLVDRTTGEGWFLSFTGKVYPAKLGAKTPSIGKPWSLNEAAGLPAAGTGVQQLAWRPGGGQLMALHRTTRRLFVLMHAGNYWTQKQAGTEVWVFDAEQRKLIRRILLAKPAKSIVVTQDDKPVLFAYGGEGPEGGDFTSYDPETGKKVRGRTLRASVALVPGL